MKVLETEYNGTLYRSRTEARWAVFMDAIGFPFVYEPEGFDLGKDGWYIPDFYLPSIDWFMEVKPDVVVPGRSSPTEALCLSAKKPVITFCGMPTMPGFHDERNDSGYVHFTDGCDDQYWFCCCPHCKVVGIQFNGRSDRIDCDCPKSDHGDKGYNYDDPLIEDAYYKARNAFRKFKA